MVHYEQYSNQSFFCFKFVSFFAAAKSLILFRRRAVLNPLTLSFTPCYGVVPPSYLYWDNRRSTVV